MHNFCDTDYTLSEAEVLGSFDARSGVGLFDEALFILSCNSEFRTDEYAFILFSEIWNEIRFMKKNANLVFRMLIQVPQKNVSRLRSYNCETRKEISTMKRGFL